MSNRVTLRFVYTPVIAMFLVLLQTIPAYAETARTGIDLARGIELINAGNYREALEPLGRAVAAEPADQETLYYAGLAHSRLGEYDAATKLLTRALEIEESAELCFELGRIQALTERCDDARRLFARYEALGADETGRRSVEGLLLSCGGDREGMPMRLVVTTGWQRDSNVILEADHPSDPKPVKADQRAILYLAAGVTPVRTKRYELDLGYSFYGNLHEKLHDSNAIVNRATAAFGFTAWESVRPALGYALEYTHFGGDSYNRTHRGSLQFEIREGARAATVLVCELRDSHFFDSVLFSGNGERSGGGQSVGLRQRLGLGRVEVAVSLFGDRERAHEQWWASEGWRAAAQISWRPTPKIAIGLTGEYQVRDYEAPFPGLAAARTDRTQTYGATITHALGRAASITLAGSRTRNESNLDFSEYTRTIVGVYLSFGWGS